MDARKTKKKMFLIEFFHHSGSETYFLIPSACMLSVRISWLLFLLLNALWFGCLHTTVSGFWHLNSSTCRLLREWIELSFAMGSAILIGSNQIISVQSQQSWLEKCIIAILRLHRSKLQRRTNWISKERKVKGEKTREKNVLCMYHQGTE